MLFAVLMGGKHPKAKIEVHDVVFAVADRLDQTYDQLRASWFGSPHSAHIDAWMEVEGVDGYRIEWSSEKPAPDEQRLYFLNFGGYEDGIFGEAHRYMFVVASDAPAAKNIGKKRLGEVWKKLHTDALLDVDDCIPVTRLAGQHLRLAPGLHKEIFAMSDYIELE
jgi:hypothetical protein